MVAHSWEGLLWEARSGLVLEVICRQDACAPKGDSPFRLYTFLCRACDMCDAGGTPALRQRGRKGVGGAAPYLFCEVELLRVLVYVAA